MFKSIIRKTLYAVITLALTSGIAVSHGYASPESAEPVTEWIHQYAKDQSYTDGKSLTRTKDGGYIVTGRQNVGAETKAYILKVDASGKTQWEQKLQLRSSDYPEASKAIETKNGEFLISSTSLTGGPTPVVFLTKLNSQGTVIWQKEFNHGVDERGDSVAETKDGGFVVTGFTSGQAAFVFKTDAQGQELWHKKITASAKHYFKDIIATPDGGSIAVGTIYAGFNGGDKIAATVTKLNAAGESEWTQQLLPPHTGGEASSILPAGDGGYVIASRSLDDSYLSKIDVNGSLQWEKKFDYSKRKVFKRAEGYALLGEYNKDPNPDNKPRYELLNINENGEITGQSIFSLKDVYYLNDATASSDHGFVLLGLVKGVKNNTLLQLTKLVDSNNLPTDPTLTEIVFSDTTKRLFAGESATVEVNAIYSDGSKKEVKDGVSFTSEDSTIATVDTNGLITGVKPGSTVIHASYKGQSARLNLEVFEAPGNGNSDTWSYPYGKDQLSTTGRSISATSDGGYIATGETKEYISGATAAYIVKVSASGKILWEQKIQHASANTFTKKIIETRDGGYIVSGYYSDQPRDAIFLAKLNKDGVLEWEKGFDDYPVDGDSVAETEDGGFVITGNTNGPSGESSAYVLKTDAQGQKVWYKTYRFGSNQRFNDIIATSDGGSIAVGEIAAMFGSTEDDGPIVTRLGVNGEEIWTKKFDQPNAKRSAKSIISSGDGGYVIHTTDKSNLNYLTKLSASGEVIWEKNYDPTSGTDLFNSLTKTKHGYALIGNTQKGTSPDYENQFELLTVDANGNLVSSTVLNDINLTGSGRGTSSPDGGFVLLGQVKLNDKTVLQLTKLAEQDPPGERTLTGITFADSIKKITVGEKATVTVKGHYSDGSETVLTDSVTFTSTDELTATVDSKGQVTGVKPGVTTIEAVYQGHTAQLQVEVQSGSGNPNPVEGTFYLDSEQYSLTAGTSLDTIAWFKDKDGIIHNVTKQSVFRSEDPSVVDYDIDGNINGLRAGITYITAEYQGQSYRAWVQVVRAYVPK